MQETLKTYLTINRDYDNMVKIFSILYRQLKVINYHGMYVPQLDADHIYISDGLEFDRIGRMTDKEENIRENIEKLTKMFLGAFLSLTVGFTDYSLVSNEFIKINFDEIASCVNNFEGFEKNFFEQVLLAKKNIYFPDYVHQENKQLGSTNVSPERRQTKKLSDGHYLETVDETKKAAFINIIFYPVLLLVMVILFMIMYNFSIYFIK